MRPLWREWMEDFPSEVKGKHLMWNAFGGEHRI